MAGVGRSLGKIMMLLLALSVGLIALGVLFLAAPRSARMVEVRHQAVSAQRDELIRSLEERDRLATQPLIEERITRVDQDRRAFRKPIPSPEGGYDVEPTFPLAAEALAQRIIETSYLVGNASSYGSPLAIRPEDPNDANDRDLALRLSALLRRHDVPATLDRDGGASSGLRVADRELGEYGRVLEAREEGGGAWSILIDAKMPLAEAVLFDPGRQELIGFKTDLQTELNYVRADAFESLERRLADRVWRLARDRYEIDPAHEARFRSTLAHRFPGSMLVDLGVRELTQIRKTIDLGSGESVVYQANVSWIGDASNLWRAGSMVRGVMAAEAREPWIRGGLAIGSLVLGLLGWLKFDWWLKGRHAFLTKVVFVSLALLGATLSLRVPFHV